MKTKKIVKEKEVKVKKLTKVQQLQQEIKRQELQILVLNDYSSDYQKKNYGLEKHNTELKCEINKLTTVLDTAKDSIVEYQIALARLEGYVERITQQDRACFLERIPQHLDPNSCPFVTTSSVYFAKSCLNNANRQDR